MTTQHSVSANEAGVFIVIAEGRARSPDEGRESGSPPQKQFGVTAKASTHTETRAMRKYNHSMSAPQVRGAVSQVTDEWSAVPMRQIAEA